MKAMNRTIDSYPVDWDDGVEDGRISHTPQKRFLSFCMNQDDYNFLYTCEGYFKYWDVDKNTIQVEIPVDEYDTVMNRFYTRSKTTENKLKQFKKELDQLNTLQTLNTRQTSKKKELTEKIVEFQWRVECFKRAKEYHALR